MAGPWEDYASTAKKAAGPWDDFGPQKGALERLTDPFRYGAASALQGGAATLKETANEGVVSGSLGMAGKAIAPANYTPAKVTLNPSTWGDIPKAVAESSPGLASDVAAGAAGAAAGGGLGALTGPLAPAAVPIGALIGGAGGSIASYLARNYGNDARGAATSRTGDPTVPLEPSDKARALAAGTIGGLASRVGLVGAIGSPATQAAGSVGAQTLRALPRSMAIEGGASVVQEAANQALIQRKIDPEALGGALVTGGAMGGAIKGAAALRDVNTARRTSDIDPEVGQRFVQRVQAELGDNNPKSAEAGFAAIRDAELKLKAERETLLAQRDTDTPGTGLKAQLNDLPSEAALAHRIVTKTLDEGRVPKASDMKVLEGAIGGHAEGNAYIKNLKDQQAFHQVKAMGNWDEAGGTFTGGTAASPFAADYLNPLGSAGKKIAAGSAAYAALGGYSLPGLHAMHALASPASALVIPAAQIGLYGMLRAGGAMTGNSRPLNQMVQRFGTAPQAPSAPSVLPKYVSPNIGRPSGSAAVAPAAPAPMPQLKAAGMLASVQKLNAAPPASGMPRPEVSPDIAKRAETRDIVTPWGTRAQSLPDVRSKFSNVQNGVITRGQARADIAAGLKDLPLSPKGLEAVNSKRLDKLLQDVFGTSNRQTARGKLEDWLDDLPPRDEQIVRTHLKTVTDPSTGRTFFGTWE